MRFSTLDEWLAWQETLHPSEIELGLERIRQVFLRLHPDPVPFIVITVAGTNGKGSSIAMLEAMLLAAGYRVGSYTSPHLLRYNERVRLNGEEVSDTELVDAFERIDTARADTSLTYFEFGTLAALDIFIRQQPEVVLLEVGLGGRLDAVNIIDANVALITSIGLDHVAWLGNDREDIGKEKAGIMRANKPVVCSDPNPPLAIAEQAQKLGAQLYQLGIDFDYQLGEQDWQWRGPQQQRHALPRPQLKGEHQYQNAAGVLMALSLLAQRLPVSQAEVREGLHRATVAGRFQLISGDIPVILDVAHNPDSARQLAALLGIQSCQGRTHAVLGIMADKDIEGVLTPLLPYIDEWYPCNLGVARASSAADLAQRLVGLGVEKSTHHIHVCDSVSDGLVLAKKQTRNGDRILVFGSFYTVADAMLHSV